MRLLLMRLRRYSRNAGSSSQFGGFFRIAGRGVNHASLVVFDWLVVFEVLGEGADLGFAVGLDADDRDGARDVLSCRPPIGS